MTIRLDYKDPTHWSCTSNRLIIGLNAYNRVIIGLDSYNWVIIGLDACNKMIIGLGTGDLL